MSITADNFTVEHFEKLVRGLGVACEAFTQSARETASQRAYILKLREELAERPTVREWEDLLTMIGDVERGVLTAEELYEFARDAQ